MVSRRCFIEVLTPSCLPADPGWPALCPDRRGRRMSAVQQGILLYKSEAMFLTCFPKSEIWPEAIANNYVFLWILVYFVNS